MKFLVALVASIMLLAVLDYFNLIRVQVIPDRSARLEIKDTFSRYKSRTDEIRKGSQAIKIPYTDLIENADNSTTWHAGSRMYSSSKVAVVVIDIYEDVSGLDNAEQKKYKELIERINKFLSTMRSLGVDVIQSHSPWEGKKVSKALIQSDSDILINTPEIERDFFLKVSKYDVVLLLGAAGNKCVLTRPLGVIELNRIGMQTIYLSDLMVFFGSSGKTPVFTAHPEIVELVALNWGYVGSALSIIEAQNKK